MIGINAMKKQIDIAKVKVKVITVIKATVKHMLKIQQHHQDHQVLIQVDRLSKVLPAAAQTVQLQIIIHQLTKIIRRAKTVRQVTLAHL